jgi:hypothetical protein
MSQMEPDLLQQPSVPDPTLPVLGSTGEEKKTAPEPEPRKASAVQESHLGGDYPEPPAMFTLSPGNGLYPDGMYPLLQPGYPTPYTQALMGIVVAPPYSSPGQPPLYSGEHPGAAVYDSTPWITEEPREKDSGEKMPANISSASRARVFVKSKITVNEALLDRRAKKNAQSRARSEKLRERVEVIANTPAVERTEEDQALLESFENSRSRKNIRSRERAFEKKSEVARILSIPETKRSKSENDFLETMMTSRQQKNHNDRMRRAAVKASKKSSGALVHEV